jgi:hypothetical protein
VLITNYRADPNGPGAAANVSLMQVAGGAATYIVAVNDSFVASPADWFQVKEELRPTSKAPAGAALYDCTAEEFIGPMGSTRPIACDLSAGTARVLAVLPKKVKTIALAATQEVLAGEIVAYRVRFADEAGADVPAVVPFHVELARPDGVVFQEGHGATERAGEFAGTFALPVNAPAGRWMLTVRSQLDGMTATLPVTVKAPRTAPFAKAADEAVVVRGAGAAAPVLAKGAKVVLPVFEGPLAETLAPVAEQARATLAAAGVEVEVRRNPAVTTNTLAYQLTDAQAAENARCDRGEAFGRIRRETVNANDWFAALAGWRFGKPVVLLDLAGTNDNPIAESLAAAGLLWPAASAEFPGAGRAVVHGVHWALAPRVNAVVVQASEVAGLLAGVKALAALPADRLAPSVEAARVELWRRHGVGVPVAPPMAAKFTAKGLKSGRAPQPFVQAFPDARPPLESEVKPFAPTPRTYTAVPAVFAPKDYVLFYDVDGQWLETATAGMLVPDLRFSGAVAVPADVKQAGKVKVTAEGVFRYSERKPCSQAQWEDLLALRAALVPVERKPMEFEVQAGGKVVGKLTPTKTGTCKVMVRMSPFPSAFEEEEAVTELSGEVELAAGPQELLLVKRNLVDGNLARVAVGMDLPPLPAK